jgi:hypothetical protein
MVPNPGIHSSSPTSEPIADSPSSDSSETAVSPSDPGEPIEPIAPISSNQGHIAFWVWIIVAVVGLLLIVGVIVAVVVLRKKKKKENDLQIPLSDFDSYDRAEKGSVSGKVRAKDIQWVST